MQSESEREQKKHKLSDQEEGQRNPKSVKTNINDAVQKLQEVFDELSSDEERAILRQKIEEIFQRSSGATVAVSSPLLPTPTPPQSPHNESQTSKNISKSELRAHIHASAMYGHDGVTFTFGKDRPNARVEGEEGKSQGDHVTAYIAFLEFLYNSTDNKEIKEIPDGLIKMIKAILPEMQHTNFNSLKEKFEEESNDCLRREDRKRLTGEERQKSIEKLIRKYPSVRDMIKDHKDDSVDDDNKIVEIKDTFVDQDLDPNYQLKLSGKEFIRFVIGDVDYYYKIMANDNNLGSILKELKGINDDQHIKQLRNSLKLSENALIGQFIVRLCESFTEEIQRVPNISFSKQPGVKADPQEGNRVKQATYTLRFINELKKIDLMPESNDSEKEKKDQKKQEFLRKLEEDAELKQGLKQIILDDPSIKPTAEQIKSDTSLTKDQKRYQMNKLTNGEMKKLFDSNGKKLFLLLEDKLGQMLEIIGKKFGDLFDFKEDIKVGDQVRSEKLLHEVSAMHLVIMFNTFDQLSYFLPEYTEAVKNIFISDGVLKTQGWTNYYGPSISEEQQVNLVKAGINNFASLKNNENRMLTMAERVPQPLQQMECKS
jgi:hypothetical protein